jgi:adhesin HecA-like repeat protein
VVSTGGSRGLDRRGRGPQAVVVSTGGVVVSTGGVVVSTGGLWFRQGVVVSTGGVVVSAGGVVVSVGSGLGVSDGGRTDASWVAGSADGAGVRLRLRLGARCGFG